MPEYAWIYDDKQGSEYFSYNTIRGETPQVNEYLLKDGRFVFIEIIINEYLLKDDQNPVKDLRWSAFEKWL